MKAIILLALSTLLFSSLSFANHNDDVLHVKTKDYTCQELKDLVADEGRVHLRWIGSRDIFANASDACSMTYCGYDYNCSSIASNWRTSDKFFCNAGFVCNRYREGNR